MHIAAHDIYTLILYEVVDKYSIKLQFENKLSFDGVRCARRMIDSYGCSTVGQLWLRRQKKDQRIAQSYQMVDDKNFKW